MKKIILSLLLWMPAVVSAKPCSDKVRLDQVKSLTVGMPSPLEGVTTWGGDEESILFVNGNFVNSSLIGGAQLAFQRGVIVVLKGAFIDREKKEFQSFSSCTTSDIQGILLSPGASLIKFDDSCPISKIITTRTNYDVRWRKFTLASLKYNLSDRFWVSAQCD